MPRAFVDTNVLVYAFDRGEPVKRERARALLGDWEGDLVISTQVLQEFFVVTTRKLERPLEEREAEQACQSLATLPVVPIDRGLVLRSITLARHDRIALCDALIVTAARESDCTMVFSEDLQHGRIFGEVVIRNPFLQTDEVNEGA
jgi:predicted nucleic acid-binding protein